MKIITWEDNPILREKSQDVSRAEMNNIIKTWKIMVKYVRNIDNGSVWLAWPQIWLNKKVIAVSLLKDWEDENYKTLMMINPKITHYSKETDFDREWCLSLPWKQVDIERALEIKVEFFDEKAKKQVLNLKWLSARIVQHEYDHLFWILLVDRVNNSLPIDINNI